MATIYEVSKLAGVSLATVSRVMNDSGKVSEKTRRRVLEAMEALDYQPNSFAQSLASNRSNCVGVLVSELHGPIFGVMLSTIEEQLRRAGKFAIFVAGHSDEEEEKQGIRFLASRNCDALILHVEALPNEYFFEQREGMLPFVLLNRRSQDLPDNCIGLDNEAGGHLATRSLLELGHRRIGYISGPRRWADAIEREAGHRKALEEAGVAFDEDLLEEGDYLETGGSRAMERLIERSPAMTAVVCANDEMAAGAMEVVRTNGLRIPEDMSVMGFDNVRWARYLYPKLSTVNYPVAEMSRMAADWVLHHVYEDRKRKIRHLFQPDLVLRDSSGPAPRDEAKQREKSE